MVKLLLFCDISTSKSGNDPLTSFLLVNFVLACLVFKQSLNFCRWWGDRNEQIYRQYIVYNTQRQSLGQSLRHFVQCAKKALAKLGTKGELMATPSTC